MPARAPWHSSPRRKGRPSRSGPAWSWLREPLLGTLRGPFDFAAAIPLCSDPDPRLEYYRRRRRDALDDVTLAWRLAFLDRYVAWVDSMLLSEEVSPPPAWVATSFVTFDLMDRQLGYTGLSLQPMHPFVARELLRGGPYRAACIRVARQVAEGGFTAELEAMIRPIRRALGEIEPELQPEKLSDAALLGLGMLGADVASKYQGASKLPFRPKDNWWRLFHFGVAITYAAHGLGKPKRDDVTDLSLACGLESEDRETVRKRWKDRLRILARRKTPAAS